MNDTEVANLSFKARVVLVGRTGLDDVARKLRGSEVLRVRTPIEAIAEVAIPMDADSPRRVVVVIGTDAAIAVEEFGEHGDGAAEFLRGLQTIHPRARLLRAVPRSQAGDPDVGGYHGVVPVDATPLEFVAAFTQASRSLAVIDRPASASTPQRNSMGQQHMHQPSPDDSDAFFAHLPGAGKSTLGDVEIQLTDEDEDLEAPPPPISIRAAGSRRDEPIQAIDVDPLDDFAAYPSMMMAPGGLHIESFNSAAVPVAPVVAAPVVAAMSAPLASVDPTPVRSAPPQPPVPPVVQAPVPMNPPSTPVVAATPVAAVAVPHPPVSPVATSVPAAPPVPPASPMPPITSPSPIAFNQSSPASPAGASDRMLLAMLSGKDMREEAASIVREITGDATVVLADPTDPAPGVVVEFEGRPLAKLRGRVSADVLGPQARWLGRWLRLDQHVLELREWAFTDSLTGALNRRYFEMFLEESVNEARRARRSLSILMFDIDNFKRWNDENGHLAGDEILVETVKLLKSVVRPTDKVCRIGGDEFAVIFYEPEGPRDPGSRHPDDVHQIAVRFQQQVRNKRFPKLATTNALAISGGLATYPWDARSAAELVKVADERALQCKRAGKNAIVLGEERSH